MNKVNCIAILVSAESRVGKAFADNGVANPKYELLVLAVGYLCFEEYLKLYMNKVNCIAITVVASAALASCASGGRSSAGGEVTGVGGTSWG